MSVKVLRRPGHGVSQKQAETRATGLKHYESSCCFYRLFFGQGCQFDFSAWTVIQMYLSKDTETTPVTQIYWLTLSHSDNYASKLDCGKCPTVWPIALSFFFF